MTPEDWVGYLEHQSPDRLQCFTENVGKGGFTIFSEMVNPALQGCPWCVIFVLAMIARPDLLGRPHPGCKVLYRRLQRRGFFRDRDYWPIADDIILMSNTRTRLIDHCGVVRGVDKDLIITIEGNTIDPSGRIPPNLGGAVAKHYRRHDDLVIVGYGAIGHFLRKDESR